jgi:hypothetical protein
VSDSYCKGCRDSAEGCERCRPARDEREREQKRAAAERAVLDVVRDMMRKSPNWVRENLPTLYEAAQTDTLAQQELKRG